MLNLLQTRTVALPSDSTFAIAMKTQQAAEREEQQRIKNLVLNYDLRDGEEQDGDSPLDSVPRNTNIYNEDTGIEKAATAANYARPDKSSNNRSGQRARKLQLSDVDWYENNPRVHSENIPPLEVEKSQDKSLKKTSHHTANGSVPVVPGRNGPLPNRGPARATGHGRVTRRQILQEHASRQARRADTK